MLLTTIVGQLIGCWSLVLQRPATKAVSWPVAVKLSNDLAHKRGQQGQHCTDQGTPETALEHTMWDPDIIGALMPTRGFDL